MDFLVKVPVARLKTAKALAAMVKRDYEEMKAEQNALQKPDPVEDGRMAMEHYEERMKAIEGAFLAIAEQARAQVGELREAYRRDIIEQVTPSAEEMGFADYLVLKDGLVKDEDSLRLILERNQQCYTIRVAIADYAADYEWSGFELTTNRAPVEEFGLAWLAMAERAISTPDGLAMLQILDDDEYRRMAQAYGVLEVSGYGDE